jgi:hypothetical protein
MLEVDVQNLVARYPWLLNQNYESIPGFSNKGLEFRLSGNRIDLILRDRSTQRPVIVEFKNVPFYRENIGQLLEYRANVLFEFSNDDSPLWIEFKELLSSPILCLVVPRCEALAKVACSLSGIHVFEFEANINQLMSPSGLISLEEFDKALAKTGFPISKDRHIEINKIYERIKSVLFKIGEENTWSEYRAPNGEYWYFINHLFINKWLFKGFPVSIGIFEMIDEKDFLGESCIEFLANNPKTLNDFILGTSENLEKILGKSDRLDRSEDNEFAIRFKINTAKLLSNLEEILESVFKIYRKRIDEINDQV